MALEVKLWKVDADRPVPVPRQRLDLEDRLEGWLCEDIGLLSDDLLVIGRQISQFDGTLDLLAVDREGNLVVIELKRDRTPREVVAQALDYASWVQGFLWEDVDQYAQDHLGKPFDEAFKDAFGHGPPEMVNERQRLYIVASSLDASTQRIVEYLADTHGVDINAATFAYFNTDNGEFVARSLLLDEEVGRRAPRKRPPPRSENEFRAIAEARGVQDLWDIALDGFCDVPSAGKSRSRTTLSFNLPLEEGNRAIVSIFPEQSSAENGLAVNVVFEHVVRAFGIEEERIRNACGAPAGRSFGGSYSNPDNCFHLDRGRLERVIGLLAARPDG